MMRRLDRLVHRVTREKSTETHTVSLDQLVIRTTVIPMPNVLPRHKQVAIVNALVEGCSVRATERMVDVSRETVLSLLVRVGEGCAAVMDQTMRNLPCERLELDEIWAFVQKKQRQVSILDDGAVVGDTWTYVAIDADTKLVPAYLVGKRTAENTNIFVADLASRLSKRVQISTDGLAMYVDAIRSAFGGNVDYAQIVKSYEAEHAGPGRYSPPKVTETQKTPVFGEPVEELVSTSYVERQNLTMRMQIRRMTRLTNAHSKKLRNHRAATALHFAHYNFVRRHETIRTSPAMAAGVTERLWSTEDLVDIALRTGAQ
jgi:IS1 family transposase